MKPTTTHLVIAHFASQLFEKWLDLRKHKLPPERVDLAELLFTDWEAAVMEFLHHNPLSLGGKTISRIEQNFDRLLYQLHGHFDFLFAENGTFLPWNDSRYPELLRHIPDPPTGLSVIGSLDVLHRPKIAIIGSRKASGFSMTKARAIGHGLAREGAVVVSGGAYGCDTGAHIGALTGGQTPCPTIVVFASGLADLYPKGNRRLFRDIHKRKGVFLSERLWNEPSLPRSFPVRNRIISGLSQAVVVVQAAERSGAMVTAQRAIDHGRDLMVVDQDEDDVRAGGNRDLLALGATKITDYPDIIDALG